MKNCQRFDTKTYDTIQYLRKNMSIICRTCLQKSNKTFKTHQTIEDYGGGEVRISIVLKFFMPELYLGLSSNPEICHECKDILTLAYFFKKKCLQTENIIGNFLKRSRITGQCVDLHDVLTYFEEQVRLQRAIEEAKQKMNLNTQNILSEWDEVPDEAVNSEKTIQGVHLATSNPTNPQDNTSTMKFCENTGLFRDQQGRFYSNCSGYLMEVNQINNDEAKIGGNEVTNLKKTTLNETQGIRDPTDCPQSMENFCKITSVFSLNEKTINTNPVGDENSVNHESDSEKDDDTNKNLDNAKKEPMMVEINGELVDFNNYPTDKDIIDISDTASHEDMQCTSPVQKIIDDLPEINDARDVPEYIHISNLGSKELEELRERDDGTKKVVLNFNNKLPTTSSLEQSNLGKSEKKTEGYTVVPPATLPETLVVNGKKMVKCNGGYRMMEDPKSKRIQISNKMKRELSMTRASPKCKYCEKSFETMPQLLSHLVTHVKKTRYKCRICGITCCSLQSRNRHETKHEDPTYDLRCKICFIEMKTKEKLEKHMERHERSRKYKCQYCEEAFSRRYLLSHHISQEHTNEDKAEKQAKINETLKEIRISL